MRSEGRAVQRACFARPDVQGMLGGVEGGATRGPGWASVILIALVVAVTASLLTQWASDTGRLDGLWDGRQAVDEQPVAEPAAPPEADDPQVPTAPQLVGLPRKIAAELMAARGLRLVVKEERVDTVLPAGGVLSQDPLPGSQMAPNDEVAVVLSAGAAAKDTPVPKLAALTLEEATAKLAEVGLTLGEVSGPKEGANRRVVASRPEAGEKLAAGEAVALTLQIPLVEVPKVTGLSVRKAKKAIEAAGLKVGKVRVRFDEYRSPNAVLKQTPAAGEKVEPGAVVELVRNED